MKILTSFIIFFTIVKSTLACGCLGKSSIKSEFEYADLVFSGTVIEKEIFKLVDTSLFELLGFKGDSIIDKNKSTYGTSFYKYYIKRDIIYKGESKSDTIIISTGLGSGDCGYRFDLNQKFIIYANFDSYLGDYRGQKHSDGKKICWTDICKRTQPYNEEEILKLNKLKTGTKN